MDMLKVYSLCDGDIPRKLPFFLSFMHPAHAFWVWDKTLPQTHAPQFTPSQMLMLIDEEKKRDFEFFAQM